MQEMQRDGDLGGVEARVLFGQPPLPLHVVHEVAAGDELDHEEQTRLVLKARVQTHEERVVRRHLEHVLLRLHLQTKCLHSVAKDDYENMYKVEERADGNE